MTLRTFLKKEIFPVHFVRVTLGKVNTKFLPSQLGKIRVNVKFTALRFSLSRVFTINAGPH